MTTIVGIQGDGFVVVGTDSRISSVDEQGTPYQVATLGSSTGKMATNGKYLLGAAGDVRAINILHHAFVPPIPTANTKGKRLDQFITRTFIPALRECFEREGYGTTNRDSLQHNAEHSSTVVVVIHGTLYVIDGDYSWIMDTSGLYAIGTGSAYALGALQAMSTKAEPTLQTAKKNITKALQIASKYDPLTGPPFYTFVQETNTRR